MVYKLCLVYQTKKITYKISPLSYKLAHWLQFNHQLEEFIGRANKEAHTGSPHDDLSGWKDYFFGHFTKKCQQVFLLISQFSFCYYYFWQASWRHDSKIIQDLPGGFDYFAVSPKAYLKGFYGYFQDMGPSIISLVVYSSLLSSSILSSKLRDT